MLIQYAIYAPYYSDTDPNSVGLGLWGRLFYAENIFYFFYSIIAFGLLIIEELSQSQKYMRFIVLTILSFVQFVLTIVVTSRDLNFIGKIYDANPEDIRLDLQLKNEIAQDVIMILVSFIAGVSLTMWSYRVRQASLRVNINSYTQV